MTLKKMLSVTGYRIMARGWQRAGYTCLQIADRMTIRLALDRFDPATLCENDRAKLYELLECIEELARPPG